MRSGHEVGMMPWHLSCSLLFPRKERHKLTSEKCNIHIRVRRRGGCFVVVQADQPQHFFKMAVSSAPSPEQYAFGCTALFDQAPVEGSNARCE
jgi:hypothetical protein